MERNPLKIADMTLGQISDACKEQQDCRKCPLRLDKRKMFGTVRGICVTDEFRETTTPDGRTAAMQPCEWRFFGKMDDSPEIAPEFRRLRDLTIRQIVTICRCKFYCRTCPLYSAYEPSSCAVISAVCDWERKNGRMAYEGLPPMLWKNLDVDRSLKTPTRAYSSTSVAVGEWVEAKKE